MPTKEEVDKIYSSFKKRGYTNEEIAENFVFSIDSSPQELKDFNAIITKRQSEMSDEERLKINMLQLKIWMQDDISDFEFTRVARSFGFYLKEYRERLGKKNIELARELAIDHTELSAVANDLRRPSEKLILSLGKHFKGNFPALLWTKIFHREREYYILMWQKRQAPAMAIRRKAVVAQVKKVEKLKDKKQSGDSIKHVSRRIIQVKKVAAKRHQMR